jgi:hypothetical protein
MWEAIVFLFRILEFEILFEFNENNLTSINKQGE